MLTEAAYQRQYALSMACPIICLIITERKRSCCAKINHRCCPTPRALWYPKPRHFELFFMLESTPIANFAIFPFNGPSW
jgi:hypothetical protein